MDDEQPIIVKKRKIVKGGGHHGGAWKVAYADFVTAMMAFFMLMWLLNATTEQQRDGLADYFSPTVPIALVSGGGDGAFGGEDVTVESATAYSGQTAATVTDVDAAEALADALRSALAGGDAAMAETILDHVQTRLTDEGLVIEVSSRPGAPLFDEAGTPIAWLPDFAAVLVQLFSTVSNDVAVEAHVPSRPLTVAGPDPFSVSTLHAETFRSLLAAGGLQPDRLARLTGHGDRTPIADTPLAERNGRIEIILLRSDL